MQILRPPGTRPGECARRVGFAIPRWTPDSPAFEGPAFRCLSVAGAIANAGHEVLLLDREHDLRGRSDLQEALRTVRVVFFWMNEMAPRRQTLGALDVASQLKELDPDLRLVLGGTLVTVCPPSWLFLESPFEFFLRGYGEVSGPRLLDALDGNGSLAEIPGLVWREHGRYRANEVTARERVRLADSLLPHHQLDLSGSIQTGGIFGNDQPTFVLGTGRGCAKGCTFCFWRRHSPSLLPAAEVVELAGQVHRRFGVRQFHFAELDFFANRRRPLELARLWRERLSGCTWFALVSPIDALRYEEPDWELLASGGCRKLELGTESGSASLLPSLGKPHQPDDPYRITVRALRHGISVMHNFLFGLVGETPEDVRSSVRLIRRLVALDPRRVTFTFRLFQPVPETPMGDDANASVPHAPRRLDELLEYRVAFDDVGRRSMPWLPAKHEREIKQIAGYYLPLATSRMACGKLGAALAYRVLRRIARLRMRHHWFRAAFEPALYRRLVGRTLSLTFRP